MFVVAAAVVMLLLLSRSSERVMKLLIRGQVMYAVEQEATLERGWETREE